MSPDQIIKHFQCKGRFREINPFGTGHIHDTFRVINADPALPDYLLQRINHFVFNHVGLMMDNISMVTNHLRSKLLGKKNNTFSTLTIMPTIDDQLFHLDGNGNYWRVFIFMKNYSSFDVVESAQNIYEGARAFGNFLKELSDFKATQLHTTIPDFHNVKVRLVAFQVAVEKDLKRRANKAKSQIHFIHSVADLMCRIQEMGEAGKFPLRVTHNDTKFNNVLLDRSGKAGCVIDLDTVMPGYVHFDFGDGVRTTISKAPEDEPDHSKIKVRLSRFKAFTSGYLEASGGILSKDEIQYLALSAPTLAFIMGVRFLTDYLNGDIYYKIHFEAHNFQRAKAQLDLCKKMLDLRPEMEEIVWEMSSF